MSISFQNKLKEIEAELNLAEQKYHHGRSIKEMAHFLSVSTYTIETYRANLHHKFNLKINMRSFLESIRND